MNSIDDVLRCIGRIVMVLALCCVIGLHWIALQSLAWTGMVIQYSKCARLGQAIEQTLDGAHPCSLCHVVNKGAASEKKSGAPIASFEDRHRVRRSNISAFAEIGSIRLPRE